MSNRLNKIFLIFIIIGLGTLVFTDQQTANGAVYEDTKMTELVFQDIDLTTSENARTTGVYESDIIDAPIAFNALAPKWVADPTFVLEIRTRPADGEWSEWYELHENHDLTQIEDGTTYGDMLFVPAADVTHEQLQFRISTIVFKVPELQFTFIDSTDGPSSEELIIRQQELDAQNGSAADTDGYPKPFVVSRDVWCTSSLCHCPTGSCANACVNGDTLDYKSVNHLIVHHTVSNNNSSDWAAVMRAIWNYHALSLCWGDIGYNYLIDMNGTIYEGHRGGDNVVGSHASGANPYSMGVSLIGTFTEPTHPSPGIRPPAAMQNALVELLAWKADQRGIDVYDSTYHPNLGRGLPNLSGHRDVYGTTTCPGEQAHDLLPAIRDEVARRLGFTPPHIYIDELSNNFSRSPNNWYTGDYSCGFNTNAWYTYSVPSANQATNWGEWKLNVPAEGSYELSVFTPFCNIGASETTSAIYTVYHKNGSSNATINQRQRIGLWTTIGTFELSPNSNHRIRLTDLTNDNGQVVWFDAVRYRYLGPTASNQSPAADSWLNSRTVSFNWSVSNGGAINSSKLRVATDSNFNNIVHTANLAGNATNHSHTFGQDYDRLYWQVLLNDNSGTIYSPATNFRLDSTPPTSLVDSIEWTNDGSGYVLTWKGSDNLSGLASYTIQYRIMGTETWYTLLADVTETGTVVVPQTVGIAYEFRSQAKDVAGNVEPPHETADISTNVVPTAIGLKWPVDGQWITNQNVNFQWELLSGTFPAGLRVQVATDSIFNNIIVDTGVSGTAVSQTVYVNGQADMFYWRVVPQSGQLGPVAVGQFRLDAIKPVSSANKVMRFNGNQLYVTWSGSDGQSGIDYYNVYYRTDPNGSWKLWKSRTNKTGAAFNINTGGQTVWFRSQAADIAGNVETLGSSAQANSAEAIVLGQSLTMPIVAR